MELVHVPCHDRIVITSCHHATSFFTKKVDCDADDTDLFNAEQACYLPGITKWYSDELLNFENIQVKKCYDFKTKKHQFIWILIWLCIFSQVGWNPNHTS